MQKARDIMTTEVITVTPETTVQELAQLLTTNNISGAPVLDASGSLLGVVTQSDLIVQKKKIHIPSMITLLDSFIYLENPDRMIKEMKKFAGSKVEDILSKDPLTVDEDTPLEEIATIMAEKNIHTLPVTKEEELVGVIGKKDIIKTLIP